jgi:signal transduction histidine kinase
VNRIIPRENTKERLIDGDSKNRVSVLQEWLQDIKGGIRRRDLIDDRSLEAQASELLSAIVEVGAEARLDDFTSTAWQPAKDLLASLSASRATQGFTPSESDLKTSFLSNLSHEFRTPLNSILSLSRILLNRSDGNLTQEQDKQVTYIQRSAAELSEMVNDLLDLAKVEAGKIDLKPRHFEVQDLFGTLRGMLKPLMAGNSLELIFDAAPDLPTLHTDEGKISQILRNLISNALKFTPKGHVRMSARVVGDGLMEFSVSDTGIGIAPEDLERIFEEFVQIESEIQSQVKGTGLGLPLSRRLAELLGGILEAHNGREAIRMAEKHIPDVMVLDLIMPDLSGFEVLREVRNNYAIHTMRVIVHTSKDLTAQETADLVEMKAIIFPKQAFDGEGSSEKLREVLEAAGMGL